MLINYQQKVVLLVNLTTDIVFHMLEEKKYNILIPVVSIAMKRVWHEDTSLAYCLSDVKFILEKMLQNATDIHIMHQVAFDEWLNEGCPGISDADMKE
jgi:hypothetical protein